MASIADITVYDGESTPVAHVFKAIHTRMDKNGAQEALYRESLPGVPLEAQPTLKLTNALLPSGVRRLAARVEVPVMESVSGQNAAGYTAAPKVAFVETAEYVDYVHPRSTASGRRNIRYMFQNFFRNLNVASGGAHAYTGGPVNELLDDVISPT